MTKAGSRALTALIAVVVILGLIVIVMRFQRLPTGPVAIAWDREQCAHCHMLVSEPAFAAQIQLRDGRVLAFDDPGCLIAFEEAQRPAEHAVYFHELRGDRWLPRDRTAFVPAPHSPMGYALGVVEVGTAGAISFDAARARVLSRVGPRAGARRDEPGAIP